MLYTTVKCDCGRYASADDLIESEASSIIICPECSATCPNCGRIVCEDEILWNTKKCIMCDPDY